MFHGSSAAFVILWVCSISKLGYVCHSLFPLFNLGAEKQLRSFSVRQSDNYLGNAFDAREMQNLSPLGPLFHRARFLDLFLGQSPLSENNLAIPQPRSSCLFVFRLFKNLHP